MDNYQDFSEDGVYLSAQEAATEILKALVEPVEAISDAKIGLPLGDTLAKMRWRKSESWRSGQSIANIRVNFAALQHLYSGIEAVNVRMLLAEVGANSLADIIDQQFKQLVRLLENVKEPESMQYQQSDYDKLQMVQPSLKMLSDSLLASMRLLQINLGFNRRDGD
jgi:predicted lipoprotein